MGGVGGVRSPNMSEIARKFVKSWPCCKRVGHSLFRDHFKQQ